MSDAMAGYVGTRPLDTPMDTAALSRWLDDNVADFAGLQEVRQFNGGSSNPTYVLVTGGAPYVMRRKPPGVLLPSAHAVDREFRVMAALAKVDFPVPRVHALCRDESVIGTMFFVMEKVEGRVLWDVALPELSREERAHIYDDQIRALAKLHQVDYAAIGLGDYGAPGGFYARQLGRWTKQYRNAGGEPLESMERLIEMLSRDVPAESRTTIVHGDFRLDNMALHPSKPKVAAVFDWELSTLGDPLADFAYFLMQWKTPLGERAGLMGADFAALGIPTREEAAALYCALTGREGIARLEWYIAYNMFRLAAIRRGVEARVRQGNASNPHAIAAGGMVNTLAERALALLDARD